MDQILNGLDAGPQSPEPNNILFKSMIKTQGKVRFKRLTQN